MLKDRMKVFENIIRVIAGCSKNRTRSEIRKYVKFNLLY